MSDINLVFTDFYDAYRFLSTHPANSLDRQVHDIYDPENHFTDCLDVEVVKVNPNKRNEDGLCMIDDDPSLNTKTEVWLEYGEWGFSKEMGIELASHDIDLDCGGDTFEDAIIKLANLVYNRSYYFYGKLPDYFGIHWKDYEKWGCPFCGSDYSYSSMRQGNFVPVTCGECEHKFMLMPDDSVIAPIGVGVTGEDCIYPKVINHPREGISKHKFHAPDVKPESGGEYWRPRGIGYDLSGFVKSKESGERIVEMFKKALGKEDIKTWLDFRPSEPTWIQVKVQSEEADLDKLYELTKDTGIITQEIVNSVVRV